MSFFKKMKEKRALHNHIAPALALILLVSFVIMGYNLGQRSTDRGFAGGVLVDTIVLTPEATPAAALPLSITGAILRPDGTPYANMTLQLHSEPRTVTTDSEGRFLFYAVDRDEHAFQVLGGDGELIASLDVSFGGDADSGAQLSQDSGGQYQFAVAKNVLLVECELELDEKSQTLTLDEETLLCVSQNGIVDSRVGSASAVEHGVIVTPLGSTVYPDGSVSVASDGVILNDGTYISVDGSAIIHNGECRISPEGEVVMADGTVISPGGIITFPDGRVLIAGGDGAAPAGVVVAPDGTVILSDNTRVEAGGLITLSCGTTITPEGKVTFPGGETIAHNNTEVTLSDETRINLKTGAISMADGTKIEGSTITLPDGTKINYDNCSITLPDGTVMDDGTLILPNGRVISKLEPGKYSDGTVIDADLTITLPNGYQVTYDGVLKTPTGKVIIPPTENGGGYIIGDSNMPLGGTESKEPQPTPSASPKPSPAVAPTPVASPQPSKNPDNTPEPSKKPDNSPTPSITPTPVGGGGTNTTAPSAKPVTVSEGQRIWNQLTTINLFANNDSAVVGKLYPGVSGYYEFNISNPNSFEVDFIMSIAELDHAAGKMPFKYRLKCGNDYVAGDANTWLTPAQLRADAVRLASGGMSSYTLEWRWPQSGNDALDTALGSHSDKEHIITITINVEQVIA